ncbi:hypothetical protein [Pyrococcus kukulkanii]|uniref:Uncharacterized protein n=1 Tax=Pyrococcus kukulkanii TaxID=1609559 RepID=A0ABV4T8T9_9EURY
MQVLVNSERSLVSIIKPGGETSFSVVAYNIHSEYTVSMLPRDYLNPRAHHARRINFTSRTAVRANKVLDEYLEAVL